MKRRSHVKPQENYARQFLIDELLTVYKTGVAEDTESNAESGFFLPSEVLPCRYCWQLFPVSPTNHQRQMWNLLLAKAG
jgi:hypothetical protein